MIKLQTKALRSAALAMLFFLLEIRFISSLRGPKSSEIMVVLSSGYAMFTYSCPMLTWLDNSIVMIWKRVKMTQLEL